MEGRRGTSYSLGELAERLGAELRGDPAARVSGVAELDAATRDDLSYLYDRSYIRFLPLTGAGAVILGAAVAGDCPVAALVVRDPRIAYARAAALLYPEPAPVAGIDPTASVSPRATVAASAGIGPHVVVGDDAVIGEGVDIGAGSYIGPSARVGDYTRLHAHVTLQAGVHVGKRCILHPGAVIGADGFGYVREAARWVKVPQVGSVQVGDDVEIGANTTVDRGALRDTVIEDGVKIDNLVQIAHNCRIGAHTAIAACVGISGSVTVGRRCMLGGGVGIAGHLEICDDCVITGFTMVTKSIHEPGSYSSGWAARPSGAWRREVAALRRLGGRRGGRDE